jgi:cytochrome c oxidase subunit 1
MHLDQVPLFSWSMLVAGGIWLLTVPVFMANVLLIFLDVKYGAPSRFGVASNQWSQLAWLVTQPQVFAFTIPVLGIAGDAIVTFGRTRQPQRGAILFGIGWFGALSIGAYAQPFFFPGVYLQWVYFAQLLALPLPVLIVLGGLASGLRKGKPKLGGPAIAGFIALLLLLLATIASAPFGLGRLGLQTTSKALLEGNQGMRIAASGSPIYTWGVFGLAVGAAVVGALAALAYWSPKISGKKQHSGLTTLLALGGGLGALLLGLPYLALGTAEKQQSMVDSRDTMFTLAAAGGAVLALVTLIAAISTLASRVSVLTSGSSLDADAWGVGQSLEWACDSPPTPGNFGTLDHVGSPEPLLDLAAANEGGD